MAGQLPRVLHPIHKYLVNPFVMRGAGQASNAVGVLHHVGRKSGRPYLTPIIPAVAEGGFVIPLVYGEKTDWCQNVLAAGGGVIDLDAEAIAIASPRVLSPAEVRRLVPPAFARQFHYYHHYLFVERSTAEPRSPGR